MTVRLTNDGTRQIHGELLPVPPAVWTGNHAASFCVDQGPHITEAQLPGP